MDKQINNEVFMFLFNAWYLPSVLVCVVHCLFLLAILIFLAGHMIMMNQVASIKALLLRTLVLILYVAKVRDRLSSKFRHEETFLLKF